MNGWVRIGSGLKDLNRFGWMCIGLNMIGKTLLHLDTAFGSRILDIFQENSGHFWLKPKSF